MVKVTEMKILILPQDLPIDLEMIKGELEMMVPISQTLQMPKLHLQYTTHLNYPQS